MVDMSKTKIYDWKCDKCQQSGRLRIINAKEQNIRVEQVDYEGTFATDERYFFKHPCGTELELVNGQYI